MEMEIPLLIAGVLAALSGVVLLADAVSTLRDSRLRRRRGATGAVGAVVDSEGNPLGIYTDPWADPRTAARVHHDDSPWTEMAPDGRRGWAWEGVGETAGQALDSANHLRRRHLKLFPWLAGGDDMDDEEEDRLF